MLSNTIEFREALLPHEVISIEAAMVTPPRIGIEHVGLTFAGTGTRVQ
jgi:hypothetical protein